MGQGFVDSKCGNCIYYLKPYCPRGYGSDEEIWREQAPCEIFQSHREEGKIKAHRCPRCGVPIWFKSMKGFEEEKKKPFMFCPICSVPYRMVPDKEDRIVKVERIAERVPIEVKLEKQNEEWTVFEQQMPDDVFQILRIAVDQLRNADQQVKQASNPSISNTILGSIQTLFGDPMSAMFWDQRDREKRENLRQLAKQTLSQTLCQIEMIYNRYPIQTQKMLLGHGLATFIISLSAICSECELYIPRGRINNCPFCKDKKKHEERKTADDPLTILKIRLAKGEISKQQYEKLKKTIET